MTAVNFNLAPAEAVKLFRNKGLQDTFAWQDMLGGLHDREFTIAKMMDLDLLSDVHDLLSRLIEEGPTQKRFIDELKPELMRRGWWGRAEMADPATGEIRNVQLGSVRRLQLIYDTNMRTAYAAGQWERIQRNAATMPYVMYVHLDGQTNPRPLHEKWGGTILRWDDPWWATHATPNGWKCHCTVRALSWRDLARYGKSGPDAAPDDGTYEWTNPRTDQVIQVPMGIDPGWGYAPGASLRAEKTVELAREKTQHAPPEFRAAMIEWLDERSRQLRAGAQ